MKYSIIGLIVLGLIAAFSAALLTATLGNPIRQTKADDREVTILIATRDIPMVTMVGKDDFTEQTIRASQAPQQAYRDSIQVIGRTLIRPIKEGQPLTADCFATHQRGISLVSGLPEGKRAMTIDLAHSAGLEGLLYPGSVVDVLATFKLRNQDTQEDMAVSTTMLHNVEVLAIDEATVSYDGQKAEEKEKKVGVRAKTRRVTLLVDSKQAEALQLASEHGTVSLAMRNPQDKTEADREPMLLHGGKLASMADYLEGFVPARDFTQAAEPQAEAPLIPVSTATQPSIQRWNVTILRGSEVETRELTRNDQATRIAADQ